MKLHIGSVTIDTGDRRTWLAGAAMLVVLIVLLY